MKLSLKVFLVAALNFAKLVQCFPQSLVTTVVDSTEVPTLTEPGQVLPLKITKFHVNSTIQFRYARTQVISHIKNPGTAPNKADFTMVIPDSAFISNFSMIINGIEYVAEVKEKEEAKKAFDEAVSEGKGAGIVSKETRDANIFTVATNIEPGQKVVFKLIYEELLERKSGMYRHAINVDPNQIVDDLRIDVFINESLPISKISVPELVQSNEIDFSDNEESKIAEVKRNVDDNANNAKIVFAPDKLYQEEAGAQGISGQFIVKYDVDRKGQESEVQVIDGYFVHYFVPEKLETLRKHVVFVLDVSGSMAGEKIEQLKDSMFTVLDDMTEADYFNIITFNFGVSHWDPLSDGKSDDFVQGGQKVIPATNENKKTAIQYILGLKAGGGTNINDAMLEGVRLAEFALQNEKLPQEVTSMIIFLTDGLPSSGETNGDAIKSNIKNANTNLDAQIFCIGFGRDADFSLIKDISEQANSFSKRIYEGSDAALQLEDFFAEVSSPLISNLKFDYVGGLVQNTSISKTSLKTFFKGGEYIIAGKLDQPKIQDNEYLSIKVVGDGRRGQYERNLVICLRQNNGQETEARKLLIPIIPPSSCVLPPSYPPRSLSQNFMQKLHAFINIKQLITKSALSSEGSTNQPEQKALKLALENNFVTDLTSLVVIRPDEKPTISSLEYPGLFPVTFSGGVPSRILGGGNSAFKTRSRPGLNVYGSPLSAGVSYAFTKSVVSSVNRNNLLGQIRPTNRPYTTLRPFQTSTITFTSTTTSTTTSFTSTTTSTTISFTSTTTSTTTSFTSTTTTTSTTSTILKDVTIDNDEEAVYNVSTGIIECTGNLTLFSKTYLRGDKVVLEDNAADLEDNSYDNLSVSASVSGSCCWQIFSDTNFAGSSLVLSSKGTYTSVSSLGKLFREVSSARKYIC